jgi:hypothetical protein
MENLPYKVTEGTEMSATTLKKGDKVVMHTCEEAEHYDGKLWVCKSDEYKLHPKQDYTVIWLDEWDFATKYLQKVEL